MCDICEERCVRNDILCFSQELGKKYLFLRHKEIENGNEQELYSCMGVLLHTSYRHSTRSPGGAEILRLRYWLLYSRYRFFCNVVGV